jgi:hypothetical protein
MAAIDTALLDMTEWLCRRFQIWTGRTNVWLAAQLTNACIILYFLWVAAYFQSFGGPVRIAIGVFCAGLLYVLTQTVFKESIELSEKFAYRRVANGFRNPRRVRDALLRISFLNFAILWPFLMAAINVRVQVPLLNLGYPLIVLTTVVLYVLACDPLPPCPGRVKEFLRGFAFSRPRAQESAREVASGGRAALVASD